MIGDLDPNLVYRNEQIPKIVTELKEMAEILEITENNIKHIKQNQSVVIKLDSLPDKEFKGTIKSISKVVRVKSKNQPSKILEAIVHFDEVDSEIMRPGMRMFRA